VNLCIEKGEPSEPNHSKTRLETRSLFVSCLGDGVELCRLQLTTLNMCHPNFKEVPTSGRLQIGSRRAVELFSQAGKIIDPKSLPLSRQPTRRSAACPATAARHTSSAPAPASSFV
jgi:hypothetical protein